MKVVYTRPSNSSIQWSPGAAGPVVGESHLAGHPVEPAEDLSWQDDAVCLEIGGDLWFPEKGGSVKEAQRVCASCPVRGPCLAYALGHDERFGIWAGTTERERRRMRREQARVA